MKGKPLIALLFMVAGCYFSPWEDLTYHACEGTPPCHADAERYIRTHSRKHRHLGAWGGYVIGDAIISVMIRPSGYSGSHKGPYKVWVRASKRGTGAVPIIIKNLRVRRKGDEQILFNRDEIALGMNKVSTGQSPPTSYDECMFLMPDLLNPKDGKRIVVEISAVQRGGEQAEERDFVYEFSPTVERGWIRCLTS
jgi:hypothetical protein